MRYLKSASFKSKMISKQFNNKFNAELYKSKIIFFLDLASSMFIFIFIDGSFIHWYISTNFNVYPCYRKTSNISRISVGNTIVDNSDVVGALPVGAAPTTSSFST